jgi:hypothetical protein
MVNDITLLGIMFLTSTLPWVSTEHIHGSNVTFSKMMKLDPKWQTRNITFGCKTISHFNMRLNGDFSMLRGGIAVVNSHVHVYLIKLSMVYMF